MGDKRLSVDHHVTTGADAAQKLKFAERKEAEAKHHEFMASWLIGDASRTGDYSDVNKEQALAEQARAEANAARHGFLSWLFG